MSQTPLHIILLTGCSNEGRVVAICHDARRNDEGRDIDSPVVDLWRRRPVLFCALEARHREVLVVGNQSPGSFEDVAEDRRVVGEEYMGMRRLVRLSILIVVGSNHVCGVGTRRQGCAPGVGRTKRCGGRR